MLVFKKYFYKNKKSKLYFGDRIAVLNNFIYQIRGSTSSVSKYKHLPTSTIHVSLKKVRKYYYFVTICFLKRDQQLLINSYILRRRDQQTYQ
jgi:hypothetical protein